MTRQFGFHSTADDVLEGVDLGGKRILITGVSAGLGVETARALAARGALVVGAVRDLDKARAATEVVRAEAANGGGLELAQLDLASLASVRACADALAAGRAPFDLIVANAGVMSCPKGVTADGFETQFGTNHLGHFLLVNRLLPLLKSGSRVVVLSSGAHRVSDIDLEDPNFERTPYEEFAGYCRSKTANVLFAVELDRRLRARNIRAASVNPGGVLTELNRYLTPELIEQMRVAASPDPATPAPPVAWKSVGQGAATTVWSGVVAPADMVGGRYCESCGVAEIRRAAGMGGGVQPYAVDPERAERLWAMSEDMVGEGF